MRVDCPNCGTQYEVPEIHFSDGARKVRCTECGYRWNQSATHAHFNEGRKDAPLLDMLEPALDMARVNNGSIAGLTAGADPEARRSSVTASADADADAETPRVNSPTEASPAAVAEDIIVTQHDPAAAETAFDALEEALAPGRSTAGSSSSRTWRNGGSGGWVSSWPWRCCRCWCSGAKRWCRPSP